MYWLLIRCVGLPSKAVAIRGPIWCLRVCVLLLLMTLIPLPRAWSDEASLTASGDAWNTLASGKAVAIMRHALAPGTGDPVQFDVNDCTTQRNLSDQGRQQARRIGEAIRAQGLASVELFSSAWCRCVDTAQALGFGEVTVLESLNSFFQDRSTADTQTRMLKKWIEQRLATPALPAALLVSHQVNLSALAGRAVSSGELLILTLTGDDVHTLGSLVVPP